MAQSQLLHAAGMELEYPLSLGVLERYATAQKAVDFLSDQGFPCRTSRSSGRSYAPWNASPGV